MTSENNALAAMKEWLADPKRPKIVHDPKLFHLLAAPDSAAATRKPSPEFAHATILYSYLLRPTTANHAFAEVVLRASESNAFGRARRARGFSAARSRRCSARKWKSKASRNLYEKIDLPLAPVLARMEAAGVRVDRERTGNDFRESRRKKSPALEKSIYELAGFEFNINSTQQLAEVLFDKLNLQPPRRSRTKVRSTAAEVLEELALVHELPKKVLEYRELVEAEIHVRGRVAAADSSRHGTTCTRASARRARPRDGSARRIPICRIFRCAPNSGPRDSRRVHRVAGPFAAFGRLFADRTAHSGASFRGPHSGRRVPARRGHSLAHGAGSFRRRALGANAASTAASPR